MKDNLIIDLSTQPLKASSVLVQYVQYKVPSLASSDADFKFISKFWNLTNFAHAVLVPVVYLYILKSTTRTHRTQIYRYTGTYKYSTGLLVQYKYLYKPVDFL